MSDDPRDFCETTGKVVIHSPQAASRAAKNSSRMGKGVTAYRCDHCEGWHVGRGKPFKLKKVCKVHGPMELTRTTKKFKLKDPR